MTARGAPSVPPRRRSGLGLRSAGPFERGIAAEVADLGDALLELAIGWLLSLDPVASVITGATKPAQIHANAEASTWRLTPDELTAVGAIGA